MASTKLQSWRSAQELVRTLRREDAGQDLIEYALLASAIGLAGLLGFQAIFNVMGPTYESWDTSVQSIWETPEPIGGSGD